MMVMECTYQSFYTRVHFFKIVDDISYHLFFFFLSFSQWTPCRCLLKELLEIMETRMDQESEGVVSLICLTVWASLVIVITIQEAVRNGIMGNGTCGSLCWLLGVTICIQDQMVSLRVTGCVQNVEIPILPFEPLVICASVELQSLLRM